MERYEMEKEGGRMQKNVVTLSLEKYNQMTKDARNAEYLAMIDRGIAQLSSGKGQRHELIEIEDE